MAAFGDAVGLVARSEVRARWRALLGLALLVALVGTVTLSAVAGARRTASALDRFREATVARDVRVIGPDDPTTHALAAALERQQWVTTVAEYVDYGVTTDDGTLLAVYSGTDERFSNEIDRPLVLDGRMPSADAPDEVAIDEIARDALDLAPGDVIPVTTFQPDDLACLIDGNCPFQGLAGPPLELEVVGVMRDVDAFAVTDDPTPTATASAAFNADYRDEVGAIRSEVLVRLRDPSDLGRLEAYLDARPRSGGLIDPDDDYASGASDAVDVLGTSLVIFAVITALAGGIAIFQATGRQVEGASAGTTPLPVLGVTRWGWAWATALPSISAIALGALIAPLGAGVASPLFPFGFARRIEADPGIRIDVPVLSAGAMVIVLIGASWALAVGRRRAGRPRVARAWTPSLPWAGVTVAAGARLAFGRGRSGAAAQTRSAVIGIAIGVTGVLACGTFMTSIHHLVDRPERWGWTWSAQVAGTDPAALAERLEELATEDGVDAVATIRAGAIQVDQTTVSAYAFLPVGGDIDPTLRRGRLPEADDEIAVGEITRAQLGVDLGDTLTVTTQEGDPVELEVVGTVTLPTFNDRQPARGAFLTEAGLARVTRLGEPLDSVVARFEADADPARMEDRLGPAYGVGFLGPITPPQLTNLEDTSPVVRALAAFFAILALIGLVQALALSGRRHRGRVAVWRALGFVPRQVHRAVLWQSAIITALGVGVGLPLGLYLGRAVWLRAIESVGVLDAPTAPILLAVAIVPVAAITAIAVAIVPGWLAGRGPAARSLRAE